MNCDYDKDGSKEQCTSDRFGDTSAACIEGYFQYDHVYNCSKTDTNYKTDKAACEYTIGVQVKDNWGWCNSNNSGTGGYDNEDIGKQDCIKENIKDKDMAEIYDGLIYVSP